MRGASGQEPSPADQGAAVRSCAAAQPRKPMLFQLRNRSKTATDAGTPFFLARNSRVDGDRSSLAGLGAGTLKLPCHRPGFHNCPPGNERRGT